jgi:hypothetical protein
LVDRFQRQRADTAEAKCALLQKHGGKLPAASVADLVMDPEGIPRDADGKPLKGIALRRWQKRMKQQQEVRS